MAVNFEALKVSMRQNKDGYLLTLAVHPDEVPEEIMRDFVGSRYAVAMLRIGDDEMPYERPKVSSFVQRLEVMPPSACLPYFAEMRFNSDAA